MITIVKAHQLPNGEIGYDLYHGKTPMGTIWGGKIVIGNEEGDITAIKSVDDGYTILWLTSQKVKYTEQV